MMKKIFLAATALVLVANPLVPRLHAGTGDWRPVMASAAWDHEAYRVERLAFGSDVQGPFVLNETVLLADPVDSCRLQGCSRVDLHVLKNGSELVLENMPNEAVDPNRFEKNQHRLLTVSQTDENGELFAVVERDLQTGEYALLAEDVPLPKTSRIDVFASNNMFFLNPEFALNSAKAAYKQKAVYVWDEAAELAKPITDHQALKREEIQDTNGTEVLVKMVFESGHKELWLMDAKTENGYRGNMRPIRGTWTDPHEDIVGAHYRADGTIGFFRNFTYNTYDPADVDGTPTALEAYHLNWFVQPSEAFAITNDHLVFVDPQSRVYVDAGLEPMEIGVTQDGKFTVQGDRVFYRTPQGGAMYDLSTAQTSAFDFAASNAQGEVFVGTDAQGRVVYFNRASGVRLVLESGIRPALSDSSHVYWRGADGFLYEATIKPDQVFKSSPYRAVRTPQTSTVYLLMDGKRFAFRTEADYFRWFNSWSPVEFVSQGTIDGYAYAGYATFPPGSLVKPTDSDRVYFLGEDGELHWVIDQVAAYRIWGEGWNKHIFEVPFSELIDFRIGTPVTTESDTHRK